jgi:hypothetical protein
MNLLSENIAHYQKLAVSMRETILLMRVVDSLIESTGGWAIIYKEKNNNVQY